MRPHVLVLLIAAVFCAACTAKPEVIDGAVYVQYPKADVIAKKYLGNDEYLLVACADSKTHVLEVYDSTTFGNDSARVEADMPLSLPCGAALLALEKKQ